MTDSQKSKNQQQPTRVAHRPNGDKGSAHLAGCKAQKHQRGTATAAEPGQGKVLCLLRMGPRRWAEQRTAVLFESRNTNPNVVPEAYGKQSFLQKAFYQKMLKTERLKILR